MPLRCWGQNIPGEPDQQHGCWKPFYFVFPRESVEMVMIMLDDYVLGFNLEDLFHVLVSGNCITYKCVSILPEQSSTWRANNYYRNDLVSSDHNTEHNNTSKWKHFPRYWPFVPHKGQWSRASMFFLWSAPEQTVEQTIETLVIRDAIAPIMTLF